MTASCFRCGEPVDPLSRRNTWHRVIGWERQGQNGGSDIALRQTIPGEFACLDCVRKLQRGESPEQGSLV